MSHPLSRRTFLAGAGAAAATTSIALSQSNGDKNDLAALTITEAAKLLRSKSVSPVDLT